MTRAVFLVAFDDFVIDRVCQPIANKLHDWLGIEPQQIVEFLAVGSVVVDVVRFFLRHFGEMSPSMYAIFAISFLGSIMVAAIIIFPRFRNNGLNPRRMIHFTTRLMFFFFFSINLCTSVTMYPKNGTSYEWYSFWVLTFEDFIIWLAFCFGAINPPPPRKQREPKFLRWLRPSFAT